MAKYSRYLFLIPLLSLTACAEGATSTLSSETSTSNDPYAGFEKAESYDIENVAAPYEGVGYEIFTGAFYDGNGDGKGDFKGIEQKLPYIKDLGFSRIWLTPIHPSPSYHGYDVIDYFDVRSDFGTLDDFASLVDSAHKLGLEVIIDLVLNHTSTQHEWFLQSASDYASNYEGASSKKDWYSWSEGLMSGYTYSSVADAYYESNFDSGMPELNLDNEAVRNEIARIASFWLSDYDIDGFRLDAVIYYYMNQQSKNYEFLNWFKETCLEINPKAYIIAEAWDNNQVFINSYASNTGISYFNFPTAQKLTFSAGMLLQTEANASTFATRMAGSIARFKEETESSEVEGTSYFANFASNHDMDRVYNYFLPKGERAIDYKKALASLYLLTPGTPWTYYGEEIDLWGSRRGNENSDIARRLAMIWGNGEARPNQLENYDDSSRQTSPGANVLLEDPFSITNHYKKVINLRNKYSNVFTMSSTFEAIEGLTEGITGFRITTSNDDAYYLLHNVSEGIRETSLPSSLQIVDEVATSTYKSNLTDSTIAIPSFNSVLLHA